LFVNDPIILQNKSPLQKIFARILCALFFSNSFIIAVVFAVYNGAKRIAVKSQALVAMPFWIVHIVIM